ncbi:MAG: alpha/beta fold hydrolase [Gammaproteobacteria bacterium]|nr:alpha/beta fold hydrolase [Gammaproteobacteria bacterium]NIR85865.1 alpha/beta fold hydrolase [Gammaproteobacteria bacterium]NIR88965.1 alpha/beta fold hydrolase [Gammaproteobacteria bacterium]NIU06526.1 alpha/beta fold hydrolase [Gammaproteobacteria bacterium]NIV74165.1 alpha/beta fold hydrolase [Gammaproteobacteria bacterium]
MKSRFALSYLLGVLLVLSGAWWPAGTAAGVTVADPEPRASDCVVLLHGMGRTRFSMGALEDELEEAGYRVVNQGYPSTSMPIQEIAAQHVPEALSRCGEGSVRVHFVTHSLGGIVVRYYLQDHSLPPESRVVMLSPPNQGSELADRFKDSLWYQWLTGPPGQQLGTGPDSVPRRLGPVDAQVGVITGRDTWEPWFSRLIPGEDDGKVSVERAKLEEMADFLVVDSSHPFIMYDRAVIAQVRHFLDTGSFEHEGSDSDDPQR